MQLAGRILILTKRSSFSIPLRHKPISEPPDYLGVFFIQKNAAKRRVIFCVFKLRLYKTASADKTVALVRLVATLRIWKGIFFRLVKVPYIGAPAIAADFFIGGRCGVKVICAVDLPAV